MRDAVPCVTVDAGHTEVDDRALDDVADVPRAERGEVEVGAAFLQLPRDHADDPRRRVGGADHAQAAGRFRFVLEREVGHDRMVGLHRKVAPYSLVLIALHVVLTTVSYAQAAEATVLAQLWQIVTKTAWMVPAATVLA